MGLTPVAAAILATAHAFELGHHERVACTRLELGQRSLERDE